jgi:hypothetical protein
MCVAGYFVDYRFHRNSEKRWSLESAFGKAHFYHCGSLIVMQCHFGIGPFVWGGRGGTGGGGDADSRKFNEGLAELSVMLFKLSVATASLAIIKGLIESEIKDWRGL